jgi:hypothetical protein
MMELLSLRAGTAPDWHSAARFLDALTLDEIDDELVELCGVDVDNDAREGWLITVKERLRVDLERLRADLETDRDEIEVWELDGVRVFASVGDWSDEADPDSGHGWLCRLTDAGVLPAAGFQRLRKTEL